MALISVSWPTDGSTADAADISTPGNTIVNEINGNLDNANIKTGAAIATAKLADDEGITAAKIADSAVTPEKLLTGAGTGWAWQSYTPSWAAATTTPGIGNGTLTGYYQQIGKTVHVRIKLTFGSGSSAGSGAYYWALPVTSSSNYTSNEVLGSAYIVDSGTKTHPATVLWDTTSRISLKSHAKNDAGSFTTGITVSDSSPVGWAAGDTISISFTYEAA